MLLKPNLIINKSDLTICHDVIAVPDLCICLKRKLSETIFSHIQVLCVSNSFYPEVRQLFSKVFILLEKVVSYNCGSHIPLLPFKIKL